MGTDVKVIANYLPQFHEIPENNRWWGEGFTDWVAVKKAQPIYPGQVQPRVPLHQHYYDLSEEREIRWQVSLAQKYGVYGFGIYHYWFSSEQMLLQKPAEIIRDHEDIGIHYCFIWDNTSWARTWSHANFMNDWAPSFDKGQSKAEDNGMLAELRYGDEKDWKKHFDYLLPFFQDRRYIRVDGKPAFCIFKPHNDFPTLKKMMKCWDAWAKGAGLGGVTAIMLYDRHGDYLKYRMRYSPFQPNHFFEAAWNRFANAWYAKRQAPRFGDYDRQWRMLLLDAKFADPHTFLSGFVSFDDTPRRGARARIVRGATPEKFGRYFRKLLEISKRQGKEYTFVTAWNEWGEGAYLEPDEENGYAYLEALRDAVASTRGGTDVLLIFVALPPEEQAVAA